MSASKTGVDKLKEVTNLLKELQDDLQSGNLDNDKKRAYLECLKVYGRNPENADPIFTTDGIATLAHQAFSKGISISASREALSCIANSLLLKEETRRYLADLNLWGKFVERLKTTETHDEFLISRILFLETLPQASTNFDDILKQHPLADVVSQKLSQHASRYTKYTKSSPSQTMDDNALTETSKLIFNILYYTPKLSSHFSPSIPHLFSIFHHSTENPPLRQPIASVLNALLNLDSSSHEWQRVELIEKDDMGILPKLVSTLSSTINTYPESEINNAASPLVALFSKIRTSGGAASNAYLKRTLLPSESDRDQVLGKGNSLPDRLLQLTVSLGGQELSKLISNLLYELSDSDPATFTRNVGLGFASGYLMSQGLLPDGQAAASNAKDASGVPINPITGQRLDRETPVDLPPMTDEEKEREAEKLFVLFERLKRTGVVDVRNPVEDAHRFEELPD